MDQNYTSKQLIKYCKKYEWEKHGLTKDELEELLEIYCESILAGTFEFNLSKKGEYFLLEDLPEKLIIRKLNDNLKRIYKDEQANRRVIIKQVISLLKENCPIYILKTDIKSFYESIDIQQLINKLDNDFILSYHSIVLIKKLLSNTKITTKGLPRGLNISATLSEIYMRKFDKWIRNQNCIYYYSRFVDDILIFSNNKNDLKIIESNIDNNLNVGLHKNDSKTLPFDGNNIPKKKPLNYLGYSFYTDKIKKKKVLTISIAESKIKKIKSRIVVSFLEYIKDGNFDLLEERINFLSGNYSVKKNKDGNSLKAGIYYNYSMLSNLKILDEINLFYRKIIYSKSGSFGRKISSKLNSSQKHTLSKKSFKYGFQNKVFHEFDVSTMKKIKECW